MENPILIAVVDDKPELLAQICENLRAFKQVEIVFAANNGLDAIKKLENCSRLPAVMLMDIEMPVMNGVEATKIITTETAIKVIMLTVFDSEEKIFEAIKAGAAGYLVKDARPHRIVNAIEDIMEGGAAMSPHIAWKTLEFLRESAKQSANPTPGDYNLTPREIELLELLVAGDTYQQIADRMYITHGTVRKHVQNIYEKLHINSKVEAVNKIHAYKWFEKKGSAQ